MQYHVDGELVPANEATVSVRDRGFMYGDAAFETLRAYSGRIFEWRAHAERLARTSETMGLDHGLADADLRERVRETLAANDLEDAYVKLSISRGVQPGKLSPDPAADPTVVVYAADLPRSRAFSNDCASVPFPDAAVPARAKTHNYLNGIRARLELREGDGTDASTDEALMLDANGNLAEGATSNLFFVRDGVLHTPSRDGPILPGITRRVVLELADEAGVPTETGAYEPAALREADEGFLTNSTWEIRPLATVDDARLGGGEITDRLAAAFDARVERECYA
ncbi:4-amino-4-deoxychorismate lyase [Halobacteriales archaeon QS_1_67_19]|nr:MAG: 4-amino-4-deoxychorismate lyase [Halobacteriales archaeon QS_1_67_19]